VFDDMLKKLCPYHKTPVNHTLEQCDMLKKYYSRAATKDDEAKKDGGDGDTGGFPVVDNVFLIFEGATVDMSNSQCKRERHEVPPPSLTGRGTPSLSAARITRTTSPTQASIRWLSIQSSATRGSPRC
jgi:hypothetical protein